MTTNMSSGYDFRIKTKDDLKAAIRKFGFVPLFSNAIPGFSIEEHVAASAWFHSGEDGVWEWKGPVIRETGCAYGKFFDHKAVFISRKWFPDFANYRRDGYDFDARFEDGLTSYHDKELYELLEANAPSLSKKLKRLGDYRKGGKKGFDSGVTRLQAQCYVVISDFVYEKDRYGNPYGWGVAEYTTPEKRFGKAFTEAVYRRSPQASYAKILKHLKSLFPDCEEDVIRKLLK